MVAKLDFKGPGYSPDTGDVYAIGKGFDLLPNAGILFKDASESMEPGADPTKPILLEFFNLPIVYWGEDNNYPMRVLATAMKSPELLALIDFMVTVLYGDGLQYEVYAGKDGKGNHTWKPGYDPEVESWMADNMIQDSFLQHVMDLVWFNHGMTEMIMTKNKRFICQVDHQEAAFCRYGTQDPATGYNDKIYINANWPVGSIEDPYTTVVPVINVNDINRVQATRDAAGCKFIYPAVYPSPGKLIYQLPGWHSLFSSKWFDISCLIPVLKYALMKNQMTIKYMIEVSDRFWINQAKERNKDWTTMSVQDRKMLKAEVKRDMDKFLTGAQNSGKSLMTTFKWDTVNNVKIPGTSITTLDDKLQDGKYIMDSKEASGQFARAHGIPLPLMGPISAGDIGPGSGSDARIHWNMLNARMKSRKTIACSPYNFAGQYNGWTQRMPGFRFSVKDIVMDTLDVNHSTSNPKESQEPTNPTPDNGNN